MKPEETKAQSIAAYTQWAKQWREHAEIHRHRNPSYLPMDAFRNVGVGRALVLAANGSSLEDDIPALQTKHPETAVMACDKSFGHLVDRGIRVDFLLVCDANVNYERYLKPWADKLKDTVLISNVCANPLWTDPALGYKARIFFVCEDVIDSHVEFSRISGCGNLIPAATNVSNTMVVAATQSTNTGRNNLMGFDKILLTGFDYSWCDDANYYAFDADGGGKRHYMRHVYLIDGKGRPTYTSSNLMFSARWLGEYIKAFNLPIVQCSARTILGLKWTGKLADHVNYRHRPQDRDEVFQIQRIMAELQAKAAELTKKVGSMGIDHWRAFAASV